MTMPDLTATSLVLEGGGFRGIYTSGVLDYFMEQGLFICHRSTASLPVRSTHWATLPNSPAEPHKSISASAMTNVTSASTI